MFYLFKKKEGRLIPTLFNPDVPCSHSKMSFCLVKENKVGIFLINRNGEKNKENNSKEVT